MEYGKIINGELILYVKKGGGSFGAWQIDAKNEGFKEVVNAAGEYGSIITVEETETQIIRHFKRTLEEVRRDKINELMAYDSSPAVNGFSVGELEGLWFSKEERTSLVNTITLRKKFSQLNPEAIDENGIPYTHFQLWIAGFSLTKLNDEWIGALMMLEMYASSCFVRTKLNEVAFNSFATEEEIESFNYQDTYPAKLYF